MRLTHLSIAAPIFLALASPALADCDEELHGLRKKIESQQANYHTIGYRQGQARCPAAPQRGAHFSILR